MRSERSLKCAAASAKFTLAWRSVTALRLRQRRSSAALRKSSAYSRRSLFQLRRLKLSGLRLREDAEAAMAVGMQAIWLDRRDNKEVSHVPCITRLDQLVDLLAS